MMDEISSKYVQKSLQAPNPKIQKIRKDGTMYAKNQSAVHKWNMTVNKRTHVRVMMDILHLILTAYSYRY